MEFIWNKCNAYLTQTEPQFVKHTGAINLYMVQPGTLQISVWFNLEPSKSFLSAYLFPL